ncbi:MAG TPA: hypothetical protein VFD58_20650 [Blastocatellia bacterium]|nr:hypothetical protein [Blastocatellia bacterium]
MKHYVRFILSVTSMLALLAVGALAQDQEREEVRKRSADEAKMAKMKAAAEEAEFQFRGEVFKMGAAKFAVDMKVVKGAPYSAIAEAETIQPLADGNRIRNKTATLVYRDGEGRTRRESAAKEKDAPAEIFINDPVVGTNYLLEPLNRVALKSQVSGQEMEMVKKKLALEEMQVVQKMKQKAEAKAQASGQAARAEGEGSVMKKRAPVTESLGQQVIEGVLCEGTRTSFTIPAGAIGNEQPITTVREQWYSPELQVFVLTRQNDPRSGETVYRLTSINRSEPDPSLFVVPADYTLRDEYYTLRDESPIKRVKKPEEDR